LSRFTDKFFCAIIIFEVGVGIVMIMMYDECFVYDGSETPPEFDEELDLYLGVFGYADICV
jgi:hypothetical protein